MIEVSEAEKIILNASMTSHEVSVPLAKAVGRILREEIYADTDFPPFDRVMMDGIAINFSSYEKGIRQFLIENIQAAGAPQLSLTGNENCVEVMTGAILPENTDTVIPYENIEIDRKKNWAKIVDENVSRGKNIHPRGDDKKKGDKLIDRGVRISAAEIALMASVGKPEVVVSQNPRIAIISTGNELVDIHEKPQPYQIRRSNVYALQAEVNQLGLAADLYHIEDEESVLQEKLSEILENHEVLMLSGGVSMGKFDFVPAVLEKLGVEKKFHKVKQKPGKPFWFGTKANEKAVFAFPGNPVSTFMCFHRYFIPWLFKFLEQKELYREFAALEADFQFSPSLTYFLQVKTKYDNNGKLMATPMVGKGSGDHANLLEADGFLELPGDVGDFRRGKAFRFFRYRK